MENFERGGCVLSVYALAMAVACNGQLLVMPSSIGALPQQRSSISSYSSWGNGLENGHGQALGGKVSLRSGGALSFRVSRHRSLGIVASVAGVRKKESTGMSETLPTPGQVLLDRSTVETKFSSSGAMEELELERGVCNPFRKYSAERVSSFPIL